MVEQLEIDRTKNRATLCWKATPMGELSQSQPAADILIDDGCVLVIHVPGHEDESRNYKPAEYQFYLIDEWHIHADDFDVYYRPTLYDLAEKPPKWWQKVIEYHANKKIDVFQNFRPKPKWLHEEANDPRRAEIEQRVPKEWWH